jgi:hypothetical protein
VPRGLTALKWGERAWVLAVTTTTPKPMRRAVLPRGRISTRNMQDGVACLDPMAAGGVVI